ncbi:hypothetical protein H8K35_16985 [Undibacterium sp. LX40W]|uniref:Lipoprotein n=1 Tax=Undibacterium nitidum TaxID=2762298 RepID=A0A923KMN5_9BURK|nr:MULTISPECIES: hypothetical protein [Undibacterium]MBC3883095.1 hypothetical protein [Undibacterium nitidum]MBC3893376.1 hypothetical protein [Undibacterium sp. LX40W]
MLKSLSKNFALFVLVALCACSPKFDWREVRNEDNSFQVLMPGKTASANRDINLNGVKATMYMTATDVQNISFSVAYVKLDEDGQDQETSKKQQETAFEAMKTGMLNNIQGQWKSDSSVTLPKNTLLAIGQRSNGQKLKMIARFEKKDAYLIQVIMLGEEKAFNSEIADMFFDSFKWNR